MDHLLLMLTALATPFWGVSGHHIIARIAESRLSPGVKTEVARLLEGQSMTQASTWADEIRSQRPASAPWHYVDIPVMDSVYRPHSVCQKGCVVSAIDSFVAILSNKANNDGQRREALRFVIHFVGDLHQPLHAGERGDKGGNDVQLRYLNRRLNLHALWDSRYIESIGKSEDEWVTMLVGRASKRTDIPAILKGSTADWAIESHDRARDVIYKFLPSSLQLDSTDLARAQPVIEESMLRAGVRLANILEKALKR